MKTNKIILFALVAAGMMGGLAAMPAMAAGGDGTLNFTGSVVDAACTVAPDSKNMTVDFGTIGLAAFLNSTYPYTSNSKTITINLLDCPATISSATLQITGNSVAVKNIGNGLATDTGAGAAKGVAIIFGTVDSGFYITVNSPGRTYNISEGDNKLQFIGSVQTINGSGNVTAGTVSATAQYNIVYP